MSDSYLQDKNYLFTMMSQSAEMTEDCYRMAEDIIEKHQIERTDINVAAVAQNIATNFNTLMMRHATEVSGEFTP